MKASGLACDHRRRWVEQCLALRFEVLGKRTASDDWRYDAYSGRDRAEVDFRAQTTVAQDNGGRSTALAGLTPLPPKRRMRVLFRAVSSVGRAADF